MPTSLSLAASWRRRKFAAAGHRFVADMRFRGGRPARRGVDPDGRLAVSNTGRKFAAIASRHGLEPPKSPTERAQRMAGGIAAAPQ
jgi:hypothetical protein